jgi:hypothetical protein
MLILAFLTVLGSYPRHIKYAGHREIGEKCLESLNFRAGGGSRRSVGKKEEVLHGVKEERNILHVIKADWIG